MTNGIFGIGTSALLAYQRALQVTGHNIANVNTEGFSRQQLELSSRVTGSNAALQIGSGVDQTGVRRIVDELVDARLTQSTSAHAYEETFSEFARQIDGLLADPEMGLAPALSRFFNAVQDVASDPTSTAARQALIAEGQALTDRFSQLESAVEDQRRIVNGRISNNVDEINQITAGIADLNRKIVASGGGAGQQPNDLLDQRSQLVRQLSERLSVNTLEQGDGTINVYVGQGQGLVVGVESTQLVAGRDPADPDRVAVGMSAGGSFVPVTQSLTGGELGGLLDMREQLFDPAVNGLGLVALSLAEQFNDLHQSGMDLRGLLGGEFFGRPALKVLSDEGNATLGTPALTLDDVSALEASDYELRYDGTNWALRRSSDGSLLGSVPPGGTFRFDGLTLDMSGVSGGAAGDRFLLQPMRVAGELDVRITDPQSIAAALPVRAETGAANTGGASVLSLGVIDPADGNLTSPVNVQFTGGNFVSGATVIAPDPSGDTTIDINGWRLVVRGTPADGDVFSVGDNAGGVGDNRGALALAGLADSRTLAGGTATLTEAYSEVVADIGVKTRRAELNRSVQQGLLEDAQAQRESISGVNLDEEAANLLKFQQAYQAAAQVIATAGTMFDTLIAAVRR